MGNSMSKNQSIHHHQPIGLKFSVRQGTICLYLCENFRSIGCVVFEL